MTARLLVGIGTGRCGSNTLAEYLDSLPGCEVVHEGHGSANGRLFGWNEPSDKVVQYLHGLLDDVTEGTTLVGDVGSYFLPHVETVLKNIPESLVICLERDRAGVVDSFGRKTVARNHWQEPLGWRYRPDPVWDECFPKIPGDVTKVMAIGAYWDIYHQRVAQLQANYPDRVLVVPTSELSTRGRVEEMLQFLGMGDCTTPLPSRHNAKEFKRVDLPKFLRYLYLRLAPESLIRRW